MDNRCCERSRIVTTGITVEADPGRDVVYFTLEGIVSAPEVIETVEAQFSAAPLRISVWNFLGASLSDLDSQNLAAIAASGARFREQRRDPVAIFVVHPDSDAALLRLYRDMSPFHGHEAEMHLVNSLEDAEALLQRLA